MSMACRRSAREIRTISSRYVAYSHHSRRLIHSTASNRAITNLEMPAMSPTMTEGGIASWKKKEGESFAAGDVLLEVETDKATIDVEAQDDGVLGKIILPEGSKNVKVGKLIALLAEEGDDISNLEVPTETETSSKREEKVSTSKPEVPASSPSPSPASAPPSHSGPYSLPSHSRPLFPSVHRLLLDHNISDLSKIKGTGVRGMLTKGDILAHLGLASSPTGTYKKTLAEAAAPSPPPKPVKSLDGPAIRRLIATSMLQAATDARKPLHPALFDFDSVIADYLPPSEIPPSLAKPLSPAPKPSSDFLDGLI